MIRDGTTSDEKVKKLKSQRQREIINRLTGGPRSCRAQGPGRGRPRGPSAAWTHATLDIRDHVLFLLLLRFCVFFLILFFFVVTVVKCKNGLLDRF